MVLLSTAVIVCIPHDNNSDETVAARDNYGFFLDGVKDGDGFGAHVTADETSVYGILRQALLSVDSKDIPLVLNRSLRDIVDTIRENRTFNEAVDGKVSTIDGELAFDVSVTGPEGGDRVLMVKFLAKGEMSVDETSSDVVGLPENVSAYRNSRIGAEISGLMVLNTSGDMIRGASVTGTVRMWMDSEFNYTDNYYFQGLGYATVYCGNDAQNNEVTIQIAGNVSFAGVDSLTELMDLLVNVESTKSLDVDADILVSSVTDYNLTDNAPTSEEIGKKESLRNSYISQGYYTRSFTIPSGTLAILLSKYGVSQEDYSDYYAMLKTLVSEGIVYDTVYPVLKKLGADITKEQYDSLVDSIRNRTLPEYSLVGQIIETQGIPVTEEQYNAFRAVTLCLNGEPTFANVSAVMLLAGFELTQEQYDIIMGIVNDKVVPEYPVFYAAFGDQLPITEEQFEMIRAFANEGQLPEYAMIAPILEITGMPIDEDSYMMFRQMYTDLVLDRSYVTVSPYLEYLGIQIAEPQYNLLLKLLMDRQAIVYEDYRDALESMGIELTQEGYERLIEIYSEIGPNMTSTTLKEISDILSLGLTESQCNVLLSIIKDRTLPAYEDMQPILDIAGVEIPKEVYDSFKQKYELLSTAPGYFSLESILEPLGLFVSEETYDASAGFLRALYNGLADYKNGDNTSYYMEWKDKSIRPENKNLVRGYVNGLKLPETVQKYVVCEGDYLVNAQVIDGKYVADVRCDNPNARVSSYFDGLQRVDDIYGYGGSSDVEIDGIQYRFSTAYAYDNSTHEYREVRVAIPNSLTDTGAQVYTIPATITYEGIEYQVTIYNLTTPHIPKLVIEPTILSYYLTGIEGPDKIVINSVRYSQEGLRSIDPSRFEFPNAIDGVLYQVTSLRVYDYQKGDYQLVENAAIIGFTENMDSFTVPSTVVIDGESLTITSVINIFNTTIGEVRLTSGQMSLLNGSYGNGTISGAQRIIIDGQEYLPATTYGLSSSELSYVDSDGGIWSISGRLIGFTHSLQYYSVGDHRPSNYCGINLLSTYPIGILDASVGQGMSSYSITGTGCVGTLIVSSNFMYNSESDMPGTLNYNGMVMKRSSGSQYTGLTGAYYAVTDDGVILTAGHRNLSGDYYRYTGNAIVIEGFVPDKARYTVGTTFTVNGVDYTFGPVIVDLHYGTTAWLSVGDYGATLYSIQGVVSLSMYQNGYSFSGSTINSASSLKNLYNAYYDGSLQNFLSRYPNIEHIEFTTNSEIPWSQYLQWYQSGKTIVAKLPRDATFTETNVVVPYDIGWLNIDNRIGEMVETITFTGKVDNVTSSPGNTMPSNLKSIIFTQKVDSISSNAFYACLNLESVTFNGGVGSIGGNIAYNCKDGFTATINGNIDRIAGYGSFDPSVLVLSANTTIGTIESQSISCDNADLMDDLVRRANNVELDAFRDQYDRVFPGSQATSSGTGNGWVKDVQTSGSATFKLYKVNGEICAEVYSYSGEGIPSIVTYNGVEYPVRSVSISYGWTFTNGYMEIPAGVSVKDCTIWYNITDVRSYSEYITVASFDADGGLKTVMKGDGQLFAFIGISSTHHYTIPANLVCPDYEMKSMLTNKGITSVSEDPNGINPAFRAYNIDGNYSSVVSHGALLVICGAYDGKDYTIPLSVSRFVETYYGVSNVFDRVGRISVENGNNDFIVYNEGGYNTLLYNGIIVHLYGNGPVYTIPARMTGTYATYDSTGILYYLTQKGIDPSAITIMVEQGNVNFAKYDTGNFSLLTQMINGQKTLIYVWKTGDSGSLAIPNGIQSISFSYLNDRGITEISGGNDVVKLMGDITSDSSITSLSLNGPVSSANTFNLLRAVTLNIKANENLGTYIKTENGVTSYYVAKCLVFLSVADPESDVIVIVDRGTQYVSIRTVDVDLVTIPDGVREYRGNVGTIVKLPTNNSTYLSVSGAQLYTTYEVRQTGGSYLMDSQLNVTGASLNNGVVSLTISAPSHHTFDDGTTSKQFEVSNDMEITLMREKITIRYVTGSNASPKADENDVWFDDYLNNHLGVMNRGGFDFDGWYLDEGLTRGASSGYVGQYSVNGVLTLYAKWTPLHLVTIILPDGSTDEETIRDGNSFGGPYVYYLDQEMENQYQGEAITGPITLYAKALWFLDIYWDESGNCYTYSCSVLTIDGANLLLDGTPVGIPSYVTSNRVVVGWQTPADEYTLMIVPDGAYPAEPGMTEHIPLIPKTEPKSFIVSLEVDSKKGICDSNAITGTYGSIVALPEVEAKDGYRFVGWIDGFRIVRDYEVRGEATLVAGFVRTDVAKVKLSFICGDECVIDTTEIIRHEGDIVLTLPSVKSIDGRPFLGWKYNGEIIKTPFIIRADMTLEAVMKDMTDAKQTITFVSNGEPIVKKVTWGSPIEAPADPQGYMTVDTVYTFREWGGFTAGMYADRDYTFYAQFDESVRMYTVTFKNGDETVASFQCEFDHILTADEIPAVPVKESDDQYEYTSVWSAGVGTRIIRDTTITVLDNPQERLYNITFVADGSIYETVQLPWGAPIVGPAVNPVKEMTAADVYTFKGWESLNANTTVNGDRTFNALFERTARLYTVTFMNGDETVASIKCEFDHVLTASEIPVAPSKASDAEHDYSASWSAGVGTRITGDRTIDVVFTPSVRMYDVIFMADGSVFKSYRLAYGADVTAPIEIPVKKMSNTTVFEFSGWNPQTDNVKVTEDLTFTANFSESVRYYTITFMNGAAEITSIECTYNQELAEGMFPVLPTKDQDIQYTYVSSWSVGFGTKVTGDMVIDVVITSQTRQYTISFLDREGQLFTKGGFAGTYTGGYGTPLRYPSEIPDSYESDGFEYVFSGWDMSLIDGIMMECHPNYIKGAQKVNDDGSTTITVVENDKTTETTYNADGGSTIVETTTNEEQNEGVETKTETIKETVKDEYGMTVGSTETINTNIESESETVNKIQTKTFDQNDETKTANVSVGIESKTSDVTTTATIEVKENGESASVAETVIGSDTGTDTVSVSADDVAIAIKQLETITEVAEEVKSGISVEKTVTVEASKGTDDQAKVSIPASSMGSVGDNNASFAVKAGVGTIKIDSNIASHLSSKAADDNAAIELSISNYTGDMTAAQKRVVGEHKVIQLSASINGEYTGRDLGGKATITIPYELRDHENPLNIVVFFIDDNGTIYKRVTTYDLVNHTITFETDHFSYYVIAEESALGSADADDGNSFIVYIIVATTAVIVASVAAVVFLRRH